MDALTRAKNAAGGPSALAKKLGLKPQGVSQWTQVPAKHALAVEELTGVSRHDLRPDIYGPAPRRPRRKEAA